jgi:tRNA (mo5U34)-methyltransferase
LHTDREWKIVPAFARHRRRCSVECGEPLRGARKANRRGFSVQYFPDLNVYDVTQRFRASYFDIIIFTGVYYHLKDPLRALALLRQGLKPAGMIILGGPVWLANFAWASFQYRDVLNNDKSNWWVPTCLREWIECNFFEIRTEAVATPEPVVAKLRRRLFGGPLSRSRVVLTAQAVTRGDCLYSVPDPLLNAFNLTSPDANSSIIAAGFCQRNGS